MTNLVIYDGDCAFCKRWVDRWREKTRGLAEFEPYQKAATRFPDKPLALFKSSVQFVSPDGRFSSGAEAIFRIMSLPPGGGKLLWLYGHIPGFKPISDWGYRIVAANRPFFSRFF